MRTETAAAASGGVTTALLYIRNLKPSYLPFYEERKAAGEENSIIDFGFHFGIQREEHIAEIPEVIAKTGVRSFKIFMSYERTRLTDEQILDVMAAARKHGALVMVHAENHGMISWLAGRMVKPSRSM